MLEKIKAKVIYFGQVLFDITGVTVTKSNLLKGFTSYDRDGNLVTGECTFDVDSSEASATAADLVQGKTAGAKGAIITGTLPIKDGTSGTISAKDEEFTIPYGRHDGSGKVGIAAAEKEKLIASNIREGVTILGVLGTMSGSEGVVAQTREVTPGTSDIEVLPEDGYTHLASVLVKGISYTEVENDTGGIIVTIGA